MKEHCREEDRQDLKQEHEEAIKERVEKRESCERVEMKKFKLILEMRKRIRLIYV